MFKKLVVSTACAAVSMAAYAHENAESVLPADNTTLITEVVAPAVFEAELFATSEDEPMTAGMAELEAELAAVEPVEETGTVPADKYVQDGWKARRNKYDRGLAFDTKTPSMPKGLWMAGINVGFSQHDLSDYNFLVLEGVSTQGQTINISPTLHYVFANNQSIGARFSYRRNWLDLENITTHAADGLNEMLFGPTGSGRYQFTGHNYMGYISYRYYVAFGPSKRFLFFNEVQLGVGGGQQREDYGRADNGGYRESSHQTSLNVRLGLSPGMAFFVTNVLAIEVQIGLLGYEYSKIRQTNFTAEMTDGSGNPIPATETPANFKTHNISTNFDFLSIAFGTAFYL
jgi:opacity protein-like surface antigen